MGIGCGRVDVIWTLLFRILVISDERGRDGRVNEYWVLWAEREHGFRKGENGGGWD